MTPSRAGGLQHRPPRVIVIHAVLSGARNSTIGPLLQYGVFPHLRPGEGGIFEFDCFANAVVGNDD